MHQVVHCDELVVQRATVPDERLTLVCLLLARGPQGGDLVPGALRQRLGL